MLTGSFGSRRDPFKEAFAKASMEPAKADPILDSASESGDENKEAVVDEAVLDSAMSEFGSSSSKGAAMGIALAFIESGESTFDYLDALVQGAADVDGDDEIGDDEEEGYNELFEEVANAFVALGGDEDQVMRFISGESEEDGEALAEYLSEKMDDQVLDDATIIGQFAVAGEMILDSKIKRIVGGKVKWVKKKLKRKILSAAQKAGLRKARRKANTGAAKLKRKKSNKLRKNMGMDK